MLLNYKNFFLFKNFSFVFLSNLSLFILIGRTGIFILKMPKLYLLKTDLNKISFIFSNFYHFQSFLKLFKTFYNRLFFFFFFRLKLKGMGFRIKRISKRLYRFYFITVNFFYLYVPANVI